MIGVIRRWSWLTILGLAATLAALPSAAQAEGPHGRPNVVFIIVDDLNDYTGFLGGHPQARTPNLDRLAARSASFVDAYATLPICAPSRASLFTGIQPYNSGNLTFGEWYRNEALANSLSLIEMFRAEGYRTMGAGKIFHHEKASQWTEFNGKVDYGPVWFADGQARAHPSVPRPFGEVGAIDGSFAAMSAEGVVDEDGQPYTGWWSVPYKRKLRYASDADRDLLPDEISANWAARRIGEMARNRERKPFFMAVGLLRPHTPLHVPQEYFDRIGDQRDIVIPNYEPGDAADTHYAEVFSMENRGRQLFAELRKSYPDTRDGLRAFIHAYLASIAFADDQIGTIVRAVESSPFAANTIIVVTSDHGWTNGEKDVLFKNNLWQSGSRVPLLLYRPGRPPQVLAAPVSHIDLYPTLTDLAGIDRGNRRNGRGLPLDGRSLVPYLDGDASAAPEFVITMLKATNQRGEGSNAPDDQHYAVTTPQWRYIRYNGGQEELYDRRADPLERRNLAQSDSTLPLRRELRNRLNAIIGEAGTRPSAH